MDLSIPTYKWKLRKIQNNGVLQTFMDDSHVFEIVSKFKPTGDQPTAIKELSDGILNGKKFQVLMLPGSSVRGIFQARVLEWVAISFSRGSSQPRD